MFIRRLLRQGIVLYKFKTRPATDDHGISRRFLYISAARFEDKGPKNKSVIVRDAFDDIQNKNKNTYIEMVRIFIDRDHVYRRGHVEFIYSALKHMEEFGVQKDLETYKALIDILPKGKFVPTNVIQAEFMHYPKQQQCAIDLLEQMEDNGVMPDFEMEDQLLAIFGKRGFPLRKYWRMMYWMPRFKNMSPFPLPDPLPTDVFELAKLAIQRISNVDATNQVTTYHSADIKDAIDDTWIISAQSTVQKKLLNENKMEDPVYVEGPFKVWIKNNPINYFVLRGKAKPFIDEFDDADDIHKIKASVFNLKPPIKNLLKVVPSVHEQSDGIVYSVCATGTSSKDSLLSWIRHLEMDGNPVIASLHIVFMLRSSPKELTNLNDDDEKDKIEDK